MNCVEHTLMIIQWKIKMSEQNKLERYKELSQWDHVFNGDEKQELESLTVEIQDNIEDGNKFKNIQESLDSKRSIFMPMKDYMELNQHIHELESKLDEINNTIENRVQGLESEVENLKRIK